MRDNPSLAAVASRGGAAAGQPHRCQPRFALSRLPRPVSPAPRTFRDAMPPRRWASRRSSPTRRPTFRTASRRARWGHILSKCVCVCVVVCSVACLFVCRCAHTHAHAFTHTHRVHTPVGAQPLQDERRAARLRPVGAAARARRPPDGGGDAAAPLDHSAPGGTLCSPT